MTAQIHVNLIERVRASAVSDGGPWRLEINLTNRMGDSPTAILLRPSAGDTSRDVRRLATSLACELLLAAKSEQMTEEALNRILDDLDLTDYDLPRPEGGA